MGNTHRKEAVGFASEGGDTAWSRAASVPRLAAGRSDDVGEAEVEGCHDFQRHGSDLGECRLMNLPIVCGQAISRELASGLPRASSVPLSMHLAAWIDALEMPDRNTMEECLRNHTRRAPAEDLLRVPAPRTATCLSSSGSSSNLLREIQAHRERERCCVEEEEEVLYPRLDFGILQLESNCAC